MYIKQEECIEIKVIISKEAAMTHISWDGGMFSPFYGLNNGLGFVRVQIWLRSVSSSWSVMVSEWLYLMLVFCGKVSVQWEMPRVSRPNRPASRHQGLLLSFLPLCLWDGWQAGFFFFFLEFFFLQILVSSFKLPS